MRSRLLRLACLLATVPGAAAGEKAVFVDAGEPALVGRGIKGWTRGKGTIEAGGTSKELWAGKALGKGDFHVTAKLAIHKLAKSAAAFRIGRSYFGFEGGHGKIFLTGPLFKASGKPIGEPTDFMTDGKPFTFEAIRKGAELSFAIDGKLVWKMPCGTGPLGAIGFIPWRATMRISHFSAEGTLVKPSLPTPPVDRDTLRVSPWFTDVSHDTSQPAFLGNNLAAFPDPPSRGRRSPATAGEGGGSVMAVHSVGPLSYGGKLGANWLVHRITRDEGKTWDKEVRIVNHPDCNAAHPSVLRTRDGAIHVFYLGYVRHSWQNGNPTPAEKSDVWTVCSRDGGKTWGKPQMIHPCYCGATNGAIETRGGRIVFPFEHYVPNPGRCVSRTAVSDDGGRTWKLSPQIDIGGAGDHDGALEPAVVELNDGRLWMLIRTGRGKFWQAFSTDGGLTWSKAEPSKIESTHAPGHITRLASGRLALVWNQRPRGRRELYIAMSDDDGATWGKPVLVASGRQTSYPFVTEGKPGTLWIGFTDVTKGWGMPRIKTVRGTEERVLAAASGAPLVIKENGVTKIKLLPPGPGNPRNSEGDFVQLKDGRLLFVYTHFTGGGGDHSKAHLAGRFSSDGGLTWTTEDVVVVPNEGQMNIMSVSLLRLASGEIALLYLRKNTLFDCRPLLRISTDEAKTWGEPVEVIADKFVGYYVLNNDRVVQLKSGRLVAPVSRHSVPGEKWSGQGIQMCFLSDDNGKTWRPSRSQLTGQKGNRRITLQEPGVVELKDGRLMMFMRTTAGCQYLSFSKDGGDTWSPAEPSDLISPCSPATIERIPKTGDLLVVWNNHRDVDDAHRGKRTPFNAAISRDEGKTWEKVKTLEDDPGGWYCYTALEFVGDRVVLGHCARGLALTQITVFDVDWLYR